VSRRPPSQGTRRCTGGRNTRHCAPRRQGIISAALSGPSCAAVWSECYPPGPLLVLPSVSTGALHHCGLALSTWCCTPVYGPLPPLDISEPCTSPSTALPLPSALSAPLSPAQSSLSPPLSLSLCALCSHPPLSPCALCRPRPPLFPHPPFFCMCRPPGLGCSRSTRKSCGRRRGVRNSSHLRREQHLQVGRIHQGARGYALRRGILPPLPLCSGAVPLVPPAVKFVTRIFHPNVHFKVCQEALPKKKIRA